MLFLDLDGFKPVNDTHGHAAGDALLQVIATRLARAVREADTVSRLGGDEFACLLHGISSAERADALAGSIARLHTEQVRLINERQRAQEAQQAAEEELRTLRRAAAQARPAPRESGAAAVEGVTPQAAPPPMPPGA